MLWQSEKQVMNLFPLHFNMKFEKKYKETLAQLYLIEEQLLRYQTEDRIDLLFKFRDMIDKYKRDIESAVSKKTKPEYIENAQTFYNNLITIFNQYGSFYISEIIARRELVLKEKELFAAHETILEQKKEIEKLTQTINFEA